MSDWFKVLWINAKGIPAEMIEFESGWDWADKQFISDIVGFAQFVIIADFAIAGVRASRRRAFPDPTII